MFYYYTSECCKLVRIFSSPLSGKRDLDPKENGFDESCVSVVSAGHSMGVVCAEWGYVHGLSITH